MIVIPTLFREALSSAGLSEVEDWWSKLSEAARSDALLLWESCGFAETNQQIAVRVEGRFVEEGEDASAGLWHNDFYDYLVNHEIYLLDPRPFHICTRHPEARAAIESGTIPQNFACPFKEGDCPMRALLEHSPGKSLRLSISFVAIPIKKRPDYNKSANDT